MYILQAKIMWIIIFIIVTITFITENKFINKYWQESTFVKRYWKFEYLKNRK